jgi:hypothetical protein
MRDKRAAHWSGGQQFDGPLDNRCGAWSQQHLPTWRPRTAGRNRSTCHVNAACQHGRPPSVTIFAWAHWAGVTVKTLYSPATRADQHATVPHRPTRPEISLLDTQGYRHLAPASRAHFHPAEISQTVAPLQDTQGRGCDFAGTSLAAPTVEVTMDGGSLNRSENAQLVPGYWPASS